MFKLSRLTDYAVVVLSALEREKPSHMAVAAVAENTRLPEPTVAKVLKLLARAEIVSSVRGANGGYALERALSALTVLDIVVAIEGPLSVVACIDNGGEGGCSLENNCMMRGRWTLVNDAMKDALGSVTLRDMLEIKHCGEKGTVKPDAALLEGHA